MLGAGLLAAAAGCSAESRPATVERASDTIATVERAPEKTATVGGCAPEKTILVERVPGDPGKPAVSARSLQPPRLTLVDSPDEGGTQDIEDLSYTLYRIEVTTGIRTDTIPGVQTTTLPTVGADGNVYGFGYDRGGFILDAYRYEPDTRRLTKLQVPPGAQALETHMAISPDARHIAYISTENCASGVVRSWPDGKLIAQTPAEPWFRSDIDYNDVRWLDTNRAEIVYRSGRVIETRPDGSRGSRGLWVHAIIAVDTPGVKLDSLPSKPDWKR